jgi:hypothetical protein
MLIEQKTSLSTEEWTGLISSAMALRPAPIQAISYRNQRFQSRNNPVLLACSDGQEYVVKGWNNEKDVVNDQIAGSLANDIDAPVPKTKLIKISTELIQLSPDMQHFRPGLAHGSLSLWPDCTNRLWLEVNLHHLPANRLRFALLAVFYGWLQAADHQVIYNKKSPELVWSVDHGGFFPGGGVWTEASLRSAGRAQPDTRIMSECTISPDELKLALTAVKVIGFQQIAKAVAGPPEEWALGMSDRVAMACYLQKRLIELLQSPIP